MNKQILLIIGILCLSGTLLGQSTERFIRIVGNSVHEIQSDGVVAEISISEVPPNEYKRIQYSSIDTVQAQFLAELAKQGIPESRLERSAKNIGKYSKTVTRNFTLQLLSQSEVEGLSRIAIEGARVGAVEYMYSGSNIEESMVIEAISDARRKGARICEEVGLTLGKILNIEDYSSGCCNQIPNAKTPFLIKTYKVDVTFELKDR